MSQQTGEAYEPQSYSQWRALVSPAPVVVWSSAYGKGKTRGICEAADLDCRASERNLVVLFRKTLASMWSTTLKVLLEEVLDPELVAWGWKPHSDGGAVMKYPNGSELLCVGVDNPGRLRSAAIGSAYGDQAEELTEEEVEAVGGRIRLGRAWRRRLVLVMNPDAQTHWVFRKYRPTRNKVIRAKTELVLPNGRILPAGRITAEVLVSGLTDNLHNLPEDYVARLMDKKGVYRRRYWEGRWESMEGAVYGQWNPDSGVIRRPGPDMWPGGFPPHDWPRRVGIDFGYVDPFVCQWWVKTPRDMEFTSTVGKRLLAKAGTWVQYREVYTSQTTIPTLMPMLKQLEADEWAVVGRYARAGLEGKALKRHEEDWPELPVAMRWADHNRQERELMAEAGWFTEAAYKDIAPGVQCLHNKLSVDEGQVPGILLLEDALVEPDERLRENGHPLCTADEVPLQRWPPTKEERPAKEEPIDALNHGCDAMRYCIASDEKAGAMDVRFL